MDSKKSFSSMTVRPTTHSRSQPSFPSPLYVAKAKGKVGAEELEQDTRQFLERGQAESFVVKMF